MKIEDNSARPTIILLDLRDLHVNMDDASVIFDRGFEALASICNIVESSQKFGILVHVDFSQNLLNGHNVYRLLSCPWFHKITLESCGLATHSLAKKKWKNLVCENNTSLSEIHLGFNFFLIHCIRKAVNFNCLELFENLLKYFDSTLERSIYEEMDKVFEFGVLDVLLFFIQFLLPQSNLHFLDLSRCTRSPIEHVSLAACVLTAFKREKRSGFIRLKSIDMTRVTTATPLTDLADIEMRLRCEMCANCDDETMFNSWRFVFD